MDDVKRWSVTYTKHIKQKRKVYQDGFLELLSSSHKVRLYDECEKLLEIKILKSDEVVGSGETLTFNAYLVDVGDLEGDHKPIPDLKIKKEEKKITQKSGVFHGLNTRTNSISVENTKLSAEKKISPRINPSDSQKIIREFKKTELLKYGAKHNSRDTPGSGVTEWQALYTTQLTQKAKKYHDGFLQLAQCGSQGRQVMLYDANRKLLDSKFLKKDEVIKSGESFAFDSHLVDIGEPERNHEFSTDLKVQGRNSNTVRQAGIPYKQESCLQADKNVVKKWHALYTAQITRKAKKYHSGILRLALCGTRLMQATLVNEDGTTLSSKHLKFSEEVKSGSTLELPKYLVEVGEPWTSHEGESQNTACLGKDLDSNLDKSSVREIKVRQTVPANRPLRAANEILSILKSSMAQEGVTAIKSKSLMLGNASQSSNLIHAGLQYQVEEQLVLDLDPRIALEDHGDEFKALDEGTTTKHAYGSEITKSNPNDNDLACEFIILADSDNKGELQANISSSFSSSLSYNAVISNCPEDTQLTEASVPHSKSYMNGSAQIVEGLDQFSSKAISSVKGDLFSQNLETGSFQQGVLMCSTSCTSHGPRVGERKIVEGLKTAKNPDECPSFDLGF